MLPLILLACLAAAAVASSRNPRPVDDVDPAIGLEEGGNVFAGPCVPFGMVKLGPDCGDLNSNSGYEEGEIRGFSHIHVSGTGGGPKYGNVLFMPTSGELNLAQRSSPREKEEIAVGCYKADLTCFGVKAELTASHSVGFHRYTFEKNEKGHVLIDLGSFLGAAAFPGERQELVGAEVRVLSPTVVEGYTRVRGGWNVGRAYTVFFRAEFDTPAEASGTWVANALHPNQEEQADCGLPVGAFLTYAAKPGRVVKVKVGVSFLGVGKAQNNLREMGGLDFEAAVQANRQAWNGVLSKAQIEGGSEANRKCFYTALYHAMLMPTDRTGENPLWRSAEPYYDDFYAIWDTFRTSAPLLTLIAPDRQREMLRSLIDIYEHEGYMPDARSGNENGRTQGGSNCDVMIADAYLKGLQGVDYEKAYDAMVKNAEVPPGGDERKEGRGGIPDYNALGYVSTRYERAGTRTMEYANCDWALAELAQPLGKNEDARKYRLRAGNWRHLWNPNITDEGFSGFIWPRNPDGSWQEGGFSVTTGGSWSGFFYETDSWEYSFYVPHDVAALIELCGGKDRFVERLDSYFDDDRYQVGNEPSFLFPSLYVYAGRPDRTADRVRHTLATCYNATRGGLPGNDDSGAMSSWFAFHAMGFFPSAGQDLYLISSPLFSRVTLDLGDGKTFEIVAEGVSDTNRYVASATLNGKPLDRAWFTHSEIRDGARLVLFMADQPTAWGTQTPPPSMSTPRG
jgi:predicted alpha-1,2-mannosidase